MKKVQTKVRKDQEKKYLTFKLAEEQYGLEIHKVIEIIGMQEITPVPRTPDYLRGVINLRGIIHPVIDLKQKFGMGMTRETELTCIIVVTVNRDNKQEQIGIIVDEVSEVEDINEQDIEQTPGFGQGINTQFILGMAKTKGGVKMILDLQKTLSTRELDIISNINEPKNDNV
jgi:purine-binding chemotaxis protein CheW